MGVLVASVVWGHGAWAICTAAEIIAQEPASCPNNTSPCTITKTYAVDNNCVLDFGTRAVTLNAQKGALDINSGSVVLKAGSLTIPANFAQVRQIDGRGNGVAPSTTTGGQISIQTSGDVNVQKSGTIFGRIDVSGDVQAGSIEIIAGGNVVIAGALNADNNNSNPGGTGGSITIRAGGDITTLLGSNVTCIGGINGFGGGDMDFLAAGKIDLGDLVDVHGSDAGTVTLTANGQVNVHQINASASGDGGGGGSITITAGTGAQILGNQMLPGGISSTGLGGGDAGTFSAETRYGDLVIAATIDASGPVPDGTGGEIDLTTHGALTMQSGTINARADGAQGTGGLIDIQTDFALTSAATIDASGGIGGG